jgi:staphylococcal nuclease domain-containing protein 1
MVPRKLKAWERTSVDTLSNLRALEDEANPYTAQNLNTS